MHLRLVKFSFPFLRVCDMKEVLGKDGFRKISPSPNWELQRTVLGTARFSVEGEERDLNYSLDKEFCITPGVEIFELLLWSRVVSTSQLAPYWLYRSEKPIRSQNSTLTQLLTMTTTQKFPRLRDLKNKQSEVDN